MADLPHCEEIKLSEQNGVLGLRLARPEVRNALSERMIAEMITALEFAVSSGLRALVLRGEGGNFCSGGDVRDMARALSAGRPAGADPVAALNRRYGELLERLESAPLVVVSVLEGVVLGGGMGMACVSDVAIVATNAKLGVPEAGLGLIPSQLAPFLVRRIGFAQARRLALTGGMVTGAEAHSIGLAQVLSEPGQPLNECLQQVLSQILRCAPGAVARTKELLSASSWRWQGRLLDEAANLFAQAVRGPEGMEGTRAFLEKRLPSWVPKE